MSKPSTWELSSTEFATIVDGKTGKQVADFASPYLPEEECLANVKLALAAPKLLAALQDIAVTYADYPDETARLVAEKAIADFDTPATPFDIDDYLTARRQIADIWGTEDVLEVRPDLTPDQAWEVLGEVQRTHDANHGITWEHISSAADELFPEGEAA